MTIPDNWHIKVIQLLAVPGLLLAYFLYLYHNGTLVSVCEPSALFDCGQVSGPTSPYSSLGNIPIALIGLVGYGVIFVAAWLQDWVDFIDDYMPEIMIALTTMAFLFSLALTLLEAFVIHAFCQYCVVSAVIVLVMFILSILYLRSEKSA